MVSRKRESEELGTSDFGKLVRIYRVQRHWSQQQLADRWGYSREYVSLIERGKRKLDHVEQVNRLAGILEIPSERLDAIGKGIPRRKSETFPPCDALVVVAATFNTINKLALGIAATRALTILSENLGREQPILVVPCVNQNHLARHPAFHQSMATLEEWGVHPLFDLTKYPPRNEVPWEIVLDELHHVLIRNSNGEGC